MQAKKRKAAAAGAGGSGLPNPKAAKVAPGGRAQAAARPARRGQGLDSAHPPERKCVLLTLRDASSTMPGCACAIHCAGRLSLYVTISNNSTSPNGPQAPA